MTDNEEILHLENLTFKYSQEHIVINNLNFKLLKNQKIGLIGPNGSGKTTLLYLIMGLLKPKFGKIKFWQEHVHMEKDFEKVRKKIGLLFQDPNDQLFNLTVLEDVAFGPLNLGKTPKQAIQIAKMILSKLGLDNFENKITYKLSNGEKKLVALATILAMEPEVLLLDEPSTGLDENTKEKIVSVLRELNLTYIIVSHENDLIHQLAESIYIIKNGQLLSSTNATN